MINLEQNARARTGAITKSLDALSEGNDFITEFSFWKVARGDSTHVWFEKTGHHLSLDHIAGVNIYVNVLNTSCSSTERNHPRGSKPINNQYYREQLLAAFLRCQGSGNWRRSTPYRTWVWSSEYAVETSPPQAGRERITWYITWFYPPSVGYRH